MNSTNPRDFSRLQVGDAVRLTGVFWPDEVRGKIVTVDRMDGQSAISNLEGVASLTDSLGQMYSEEYAIVPVPARLASAPAPLEPVATPAPAPLEPTTTQIVAFYEALASSASEGDQPQIQVRKALTAVLNAKEAAK